MRARQPSEWGNNTVVQVFKQLRQIPCDDDALNSLLMEASCLVHNLRTHFTLRNQVKRFFVNLESYTTGYEE